MRKTSILFVILFATCMAVSAAAEQSASAVLPSVDDWPAEQDAGTCGGKSAEEILREYKLRAEESAIPPCPENTTCAGGGTVCGGSTPCAATGGTTLTDTGDRKCDDGNPPPFMCPQDETIHIVTRDCNQCPCCTAEPFPCFCPNPPLCGSAVTGFVCQ